LAVRGEKWMTLNTGEELVRIAGLIRSEGIGTDNTVPSTRAAAARITHSATGAFANTSQPGFLDRLFMSPLGPFGRARFLHYQGRRPILAACATGPGGHELFTLRTSSAWWWL